MIAMMAFSLIVFSYDFLFIFYLDGVFEEYYCVDDLFFFVLGSE